jgi:hypothetical protein
VNTTRAQLPREAITPADNVASLEEWRLARYPAWERPIRRLMMRAARVVDPRAAVSILEEGFGLMADLRTSLPLDGVPPTHELEAMADVLGAAIDRRERAISS